MANPSDGGKAYAPPQQRVVPPEATRAPAVVEFGANSDRQLACGLNSADLTVGEYQDACGEMLRDVLREQGEGIALFGALARTAEAPTTSRAMAAQLATAVLASAAVMMAASIGPAALAAGATAAAALALESAYRAVIAQVTRTAAPEVADALAGASNGDRITAFCDVLCDALENSQIYRQTALIEAEHGLDERQLCALEAGLNSARLAASRLQYQACVEEWARVTAAARDEEQGDTRTDDGRDRETELTVSLSIDPKSPDTSARVTGARLPGLAGLLGPLARQNVNALRLSKTVVFSGVEIQIGADNRVISIDATPEGREVLRRLGSGSEDRALWQATTGPIGDTREDLHVTSGASKLYTLLVGSRTLADLGVK